MTFPQTDILIVTYNARSSLVQCLESVFKHTRNVPYRLTVVDNASHDGTAEYLKKHYPLKCHLIQSGRNLGFSGAANLAIRNTANPWTVFLDDDVVVTPGWLEKLHRRAAATAKVGIVGPKVLFPDNRIFCAEFSINPFRSAGWGEKDLGQRDYFKEVDALPGPCWLMPRPVLQEVGDFDERFFPCQYEDIDYCLRVRLAGYKVLYDGRIKIIHHNLLRAERPEYLKNEMKFRNKWGKTLDRFPLAPTDADDKLLALGARLFRREIFFKAKPYFGPLAKANANFPETVYRGIAYRGLGKKRNAVREFRTALGLMGSGRYFPKDTIATGLYYALSVYFRRLGLKREEYYCEAELMRIRDNDKKRLEAELLVAEHVMLPIAGWRVRVSSKDLRFMKVLQRYIPHAWRRAQIASEKKSRNVSSLYLMRNFAKKARHDFLANPRGISFHSSANGIYRKVDPEKNRVLTLMNRKKYFKDNWILHGAFLWPLSLLLRFQDASLVHGALLEWDGKGTLIMGKKGAGKSTLSVACVSQGYRYFSDEHPILELAGAKVRGHAFISPIGLDEKSAGNFPALKSHMRWSAARGKYLLYPETVWPGRLGRRCSISSVIFPEFGLRNKLSVKKLNPKEFMQAMLRDEYLGALTIFETKTPNVPTSWRLATLLSRTARGYAIKYGPDDIIGMPSLLKKI